MRTKSLLVAICLLLVSATLLGTASFAWFSMNTEVAVDGIEVEAYSDSLFLEISKEKADNYSTSVSFAGEKEYLRLAKHGFVSEAYTVTETKITQDTYFTTSNTTQYYEKVELNDSNLKYVLVSGLEEGGDVEGLYKNPVFVKLSNSAVFENGVTYFEKTGSKYAQLTSVTAGESAAGYYTLSLVYTQISNAEAKAEDGVTYYTESNGVYTEVEVEVGTTLVNNYYTAAAIAAEDADATYDDSAVYFKKDGNDYYVVDTIFPGTNLKGYYTLTVSEIQDLTAVTGKVFVQTATDEYSLLGDYTTATDITNKLYFGRAYSDSIVDGDTTDALNVIKDEALSSYRYMQSIYLRNALNTNDSRNLRASFDVKGSNPLTNAVRVVLVVSDVTDANAVTYVNKVEFANTATTKTTTYGTGNNIVNLLAGNKAQTLKVDVYVYYDGSDAAAMNATDGVLNLSGNEIEIKFTIDDVDYNVNP